MGRLNFQCAPHNQWPRIVREETERRLVAALGQSPEYPVMAEMANYMTSDNIGLQLRCGSQAMAFDVAESDLGLIPAGQMGSFAEKYIEPFVRWVADFAPYPEGVVPDA